MKHFYKSEVNLYRDDLKTIIKVSIIVNNIVFKKEFYWHCLLEPIKWIISLELGHIIKIGWLGRLVDDLEECKTAHYIRLGFKWI